ncbi:MAG: insulinase family protein, partial [Opitutales bacterium]|nr:insulinase family protein [Opitutales bacterium]
MVKKTIFKTAMLAAIFAAGQAIANSNMLNDNSPLNGAPAMQMDPRLAYEILPNGFSVAAMKNAEPPNRISMRLLVRRGSSTEKSGQEGIAHFTEHMAFNGTKNFPKGEMVEYFQRLGMAFGADTNAHTSFNETVYKIDMPENSPKMIDDGLKLLSDYAGGMLFDEGEIERERGVIIAEKKARDSARYRSFVDFFESVFKGSPYSGRMPIGLESVIKNAKRSEFVDFYKANYRPENMTLVVVGDIDEKFILKEAKKYFSNLKADESVQAAFVNAAGEQAQSAQVYSSFCDADLAESGAGVYLVSKPVFPKDCIEARIFEIRMAAISCAIDLRFNSKKTSADSNFINAYSYFSDFEKYRDFFAIEVAANVSKSPEALAEVLNMYEGIVESGFGQWEIEKAKSDILNQLESAIKAKGTRKSALLSNKLVDSFSSGEIPTSPELDFEIAKFAFKNFGAEQATRLFDNYRAQSELFIRATDAKKEFLPADFDKFYSELKAAKKFCAPLAGGELIFDEFEGSGEIVSRKTNPLGFEEIVFKNGVRANLKPTDFAKDEVAISIAFGGGKYDIPKGNPEIAKAITGFFLGGTARQSYDEINVAKSDKNINMGIALDDDCFIFKVRTNTKNLREALALAATYINSPAFRPDAINAIKKKLEEE